MKDLMTDRVVLITGGTQGIGGATAVAAAREGARGVAIVGRDAAKAQPVLDAIAGHGAEALMITADLLVPGEAERAVAETIERWGRIDSLVNAAGLTTRGTVTDTSHELLQQHLQLNLASPFFAMARTIDDLRQRSEPGTIVNVISISSHAGQPYLAPYVASKGGLAAATKNAAYAHRFDRIRINGLNIGWTQTPGEDATQRAFHGGADGWQERAAAQQPMGRLGQPDEIADAIVFLLSERSGVVTGSIIDWDQNVIGGYE